MLTGTRAMRKDARRSRDAILTAASELLSTAGGEVPMYEIARRAGVGQATLYRHFPNRSQLIATIFEERADALERLGAEHAGTPEAFFVLLQALTEEQVRLHGLVGVLRAEGEPVMESLRLRVLNLFAEPLLDAKAAGRVRDDLEVDDVALIGTMVDGVLDEVTDPEQRSSAASRARDLVLKGVRARSAPNGAGQSQAARSYPAG